MSHRILFVDHENVQKVDLSGAPPDSRVMVFYGGNLKKLPEELVVRAQPLGERWKWIKISGQGPNALDFHIAYYLGQELTRNPQANCVILSRDTGFDPLVRHLQGLGHHCRRVTTVKEAWPAGSARSTKDDYARLKGLLSKDKNPPVRRRGLDGRVKSWFPELSVESRAVLVQRLIDEKIVAVEGGKLVYRK